MLLRYPDGDKSMDRYFSIIVGNAPNLKKVTMCSTFAAQFESTNEIRMPLDFGEYKSIPITITD